MTSGLSTLHKRKSHRKRDSVEKKPLSDRPVNKPEGHFLYWSLMWEGLAHYRCFCTWEGAPGHIRKYIKWWNKPVNSTFPQPLPLGPYLEIPKYFDNGLFRGSINQVSPFPPQYLMGMVFITAAEALPVTPVITAFR